MSEWISTRNFGIGIGLLERASIMRKFSADEWNYAKSFLVGGRKITKNAIIISDKAKAQLGVDLFPMLKTETSKANRDTGSAKFSMFSKNGESWLFDLPARFYLKKDAVFEELNDEKSTDNIISVRIN